MMDQSLEILTGVISRTNVEQNKKSSSSKVPGSIRKHTSSSLIQSRLKSESARKLRDGNITGGGEICLPATGSSHEIKEVAVSRVSCHRCGNIRKNKLQCTRNMCPYIFCGKCVERMREEHGQNVFDDGCPVCKELCCCANKTINCDRTNHCYRKCPASKHSHKQCNGRLTSGGVMNGGTKLPMSSWNYGIPHQFIPNPAMYYGSQYPFPSQPMMPNNFMGGFLPPNSEENSSTSSDASNEVNGNLMGNANGPVTVSSNSSVSEVSHAPMMNRVSCSFDQEQNVAKPMPSVATETTVPSFESFAPEIKKSHFDCHGRVQGYPVSHGFHPNLCMGMVTDYYLDDSRVPVPAPGREQFQLPMAMPFQLPNFGGVSTNTSNSFGTAPSTTSNPAQHFPMTMNMNNMEPHQVAAFNKVLEGAMTTQANHLHSFSQFFQAHQLHARQQQERYQQQQAHHLKMIEKPLASPSQQILHRFPQPSLQRIFEASQLQFPVAAAEDFFSGDNNGMIGDNDFPMQLKKPDIVGADEVSSVAQVQGMNA